MIRSSSSLHKLYLSLHEERGREYESCTATSRSLNTAKGVCRVEIRGFVDKNISSYNKPAQEAFFKHYKITLGTEFTEMMWLGIDLSTIHNRKAQCDVVGPCLGCVRTFRVLSDGSRKQAASWVTSHCATTSSRSGGGPPDSCRPGWHREEVQREEYSTGTHPLALTHWSSSGQRGWSLRRSWEQRARGQWRCGPIFLNVFIRSLNACRTVSSPDGVERPAGLHRRLNCRAGAHQHGTVDVGCNYQDAEEDGPDDGALQTQIVSSACHRQTCQIRVSTPETQRQGNRSTQRNT